MIRPLGPGTTLSLASRLWRQIAPAFSLEYPKSIPPQRGRIFFAGKQKIVLSGPVAVASSISAVRSPFCSRRPQPENRGRRITARPLFL